MSDVNGTKSNIIKELRNSMNVNVDIDFSPKNIGIICSKVFIGMGEFVSDCINELYPIPSTVTVDTRIPGWVDENTLMVYVVDSSRKNNFRGMLDRLKKKGCKIILITDFDTDVSKITVYHHMIKSSNKYAILGETIGTLISIFASLKLASKEIVENYLTTFEEKYQFLENKIDFDKYSDKNIMICYPPNLRSTATVWKMMFTEKTGKFVFATEYPEFDHNEIVGWCMSPNQSKNFVIIFICDENAIELTSVISESLIEVLNDSGVETIKIKLSENKNFGKNFLGFIIGEASAYGGKE